MLMQKYSAYLPAFLMDVCISSILTNTAFYVSYLHFSSTFLGTLNALNAGFFCALAIPFGRLSDRIGRPRILTIACLLFATVSILLPLCTQKLHLLIAFPCTGIGMALFWPTYEAWVAEREGEGGLIRRITTFNLFWTAGITAGPMVSSYLYRGVSPLLPFYFAAMCSLLNWLAIKFQGTVFRQTQSKWAIEKMSSVPPTTHHAYLKIARLANFSSGFSAGIVRALMPKLTVEMGIPATGFGNLILISGATQWLAFLALGRNFSRGLYYRFSPLLGIQISTIFAFLILARTPYGPWWILSFAVIGVSAAGSYFSSMYYSLHDQHDKGNKSGWHEAIIGAGLLISPPLGGIAADSSLGVHSPYLLSAVVALCCIGVQTLIWLADRSNYRKRTPHKSLPMRDNDKAIEADKENV